jgi:hypothetical protein
VLTLAIGGEDKSRWNTLLEFSQESVMRKKEKVYYRVIAMKDGAILVAMPDRKPAKKSLRPGEAIDEDGIYRCYVEGVKDYPDIYNGTRPNPVSILATNLNIKRALRRQVEPRLDAIQNQVAEMQDQMSAVQKQLDRIEKKLG